jgi:hypothetical protein
MSLQYFVEKKIFLRKFFKLNFLIKFLKIKMSFNQNAFYQTAFLSKCLFIKMPFYQNAFLSKCLFIKMPFYQNAFLSQYCVQKYCV